MASKDKLAHDSDLLDEEQPLQPKLSNDGSKKVPAFKLFGMGTTALIITYYAACSSTMLVINKVAIYKLPCPTFLLFCQLSCSVAVVVSGERLGLLKSDRLELEKLRKFMWVIMGFLGCIFANMKVLQHANVETFITFRSSTPLVLSLCDYAFLGRMLPNARSWLCLFVLLLGAIGYVMFDSDFKLNAFIWLMLWYVFFTFDAVYVKHITDTVKMTNWGRVYYTNLLALIPLVPMLPTLREHEVLATVTWDLSTVFPLILSCMVGVCMSHASYLLREVTSATLFTVVGILCKIITVVINVLIWDKHATPAGIACLMVCVLAGTFYQQAPKRCPEV